MRRAVLVVLAVGLTAAAGDPPTSNAPALPYESDGVCPFECCTYRTWTVTVDTDIHSDRRDGAPVFFSTQRGQRVEGVTGVVVTTRLGRAIVRTATTIGVGQETVAVEPGDEVYILHYQGEGYWRFWVHGRVGDDQLPDMESECIDDAGRSFPCAIQIVEEPETTWWAKIRSGSREGWTRELDHFTDIDACGY